MSFKKCALKAGITSEDMAEIRQHIQGANSEAQGVQDYLDGIDADLNDLRNQTGTQVVTEQVETEGEAITGDIVDLIKGLKPSVLSQEQDTAKSILALWRESGIDGAISETEKTITVDKIVVPEGDRGSGIGSTAMRQLMAYADRSGKAIALTPSKDFGAKSVPRLKKFYKDLGFVENKGKVKDFEISESLYRPAAQQEDATGISKEIKEKILNKNQVDRGLKAPKSARFWRGIGKNSGSAGSTYGTGLYVARSRAEAKEYAGEGGKLYEMDRSDLPQDPLRFSTIMDYQNWLNRATDSMEMKGPREFNAKYPDVREFIQSLDPALDGIQIGTGSDSIFVNYGGRKLFEQEGEIEPRGQISILPDAAIIKLYKSANLSTFLHESGHLFLEMTGKLYGHAKATPEIKADGDAILSFLGAKSFDSITVEQHEKWARAQEKYFGEGKAPSVELQTPFRRFSQWIKQVYKSLTRLNVELTDDVRQVMDRMLASDEQIDRLSGNFKPLFESAEDAEMTKEEYAAYEGNASPDAAKEDLFKKLVKELRRQETKWWKDEKSRIQAKASDRLAVTPVYSAEKHIRENDIKLSKAEIKAVFDGKIPRRLYGINSDDGVSASDIAPAFGFASGEEMIAEMGGSATLSKAASNQADAAMFRMHGDMLSDGSIEEQAEIAMRDASRAKKLLSELRSLSKKTGEESIDRDSLKEYAKATISKLQIRSIRPSQYRAAEIRAAREAATAKSKGDISKAKSAKTQELINFYLGKEAFLAKDRAEKIRSKHKAIQVKSFDAKRYNNEYVNVAKTIIRVFDYRKTSRADAERNKLELDNARLWIESQQTDDAEKSSPYLVQADILGRLITYKEMTVEDLQGLDDTVTSLMKAAREDSDNDREKFNASMDELGDSLVKNRIKTFSTDFDTDVPYVKARELFEGVTSALRKMDSLVRQADAFKEQGPMWQAAIKPLLHASNKALTMRNTAGEDLRAIFAGYDGVFGSGIIGDMAKDAAGIDGGKKTFTFESGQVHRLSYGARISVALNMGNDGNYEALTTMNTLPLTDGDVNEIVSSLSEKDWDLVQNLWAYIDTYWPMAAELEKERSGAAPIKVSGRPFVTPAGRSMKGGYYPLSADPAGDTKLGDIDTQAAKVMNGGSVSKATKTGSLIERTKFGGKKINFSINVVFNHIDEVIHDVSHWGAVNSVNRALSNHRVNGELTKSLGTAGVKAIQQRLKEVAAGPQRIDALTWWERPLRYARLAATYGALGYSVSTSLKNIVGLTTAVPEVGSKLLAEAGIEWMTSPIEVGEFIKSKSEYMIERGQVINRDIAQIRASIKTDRKIDKLKDYSFWFMTQTDKAVTRPIWLAAYRKGGTMFETESEAIDYADQTVRRTQGSGDTMDLSNVETRSELMKTMTIMYSAMNAIYNITAEQHLRYKAQGIEGAGSITGFQYFTNMMWLTVIPGLIMALIMRSDKDDEPEKVAKHIGWEIAGQTLGMVPIVRDAASLARYGSSFPTPLVDVLSSPVEFSKQVSQGKIDKGLLRATTGIMAAAQVPGTSQLNRTFGYLIDLNDGEIDSFSPWELIVTGKE